MKFVYNLLVCQLGVKHDIGTVEKLTLTAADRRINMSFMKISYSQGARNKDNVRKTNGCNTINVGFGLYNVNKLRYRISKCSVFVAEITSLGK